MQQFTLFLQKPSAFVLTVVLLFSCTKNSTPNQVIEPDPTPTGTVISTGGFKSNAHFTSGTAKYSTSAAGKKFIVFENFKTDNGPDLRVYLSKNAGVNDYVELGKLKAVSGNFSYELPAGVNPSTHNYVLIWCDDFSVLFGHAVLQ